MSNEIIFLLHCFFALFPLLCALYFSRLDLCFIISALYIMSINFFVQKEIVLFGFHTTTVEPFALAVFYIGNYIHGKYGEKIAWNLLLNSIISTLIISLAVYFIPLYHPSSYDTCHQLYKMIIMPGIQSVLVSLLVFMLSYSLERFLYRFFSRNYSHIPFIAGFFAILISQFFDTALYGSLFFFSRGFLRIKEQVLYAYAIKCIGIFCMYFFPFYSFFKKKIRKDW